MTLHLKGPGFRDHYQQHIVTYAQQKPTLRPYFLTKDFYSTGYRDAPTMCHRIFQLNALFYIRLVSALIKNYQRPGKRHLQPRSFDFLDIPGSRQSVSPSQLAMSEWPHIHSIIFIDPTILPSFETLSQQRFQSITRFRYSDGTQPLLPLKSVDARPITHNLGGVVSYATKLFRTTGIMALNGNATLFDQMPHSQSRSAAATHP
ncbi:hypothetical protein SAMN02983003_2560 [Devosia enhydra]|uniref:Uncharacterized protein n=1 Tax=Devosia enhydra TaxID=665118 RepID=A0A1K2HZ34_9HYPH|nr:hypothetical protein [Devosia enhydra]SFZ85397.1 hypothetical protein SAMN02983003_2560 [Devosia enhydra]